MLAKPRLCSCSVWPRYGRPEIEGHWPLLADSSVCIHCMGTTLLHLAHPFYASPRGRENVGRGGEEGFEMGRTRHFTGKGNGWMDGLGPGVKGLGRHSRPFFWKCSVGFPWRGGFGGGGATM